MHKVHMVTVCPAYDENGQIAGMKYMDSKLRVEDSENLVDEFMKSVGDVVNANRSIILYRQDVRSFADKVGVEEAFKNIKSRLRSNYTVLKLKYNPRTQEFCGMKTAFIIHKR